jgi:predicted dithiol-disulfide oxidoreductase (DUF899 family)
MLSLAPRASPPQRELCRRSASFVAAARALPPLGSEDREGGQDSTISVFTRDSDGALRHFYSAHPGLAPDIKERGIDEMSPIWNVLDLTPQGRGTFYASLDYGTKVQIAKQ